MPKVILIDDDGSESRTLDVVEGEPLMHALRDAGLVDAVCGGALACGTCAVRLESGNACVGTPPDEMETALLEGLGCEGEGQRLSCQLNVTSEMDGMRLRVLVIA